MTDLLHSRYRLDEVLGQGAMGVVWRAHDEVLDRPIAVKELRPAPGVDPGEALDRFLVEARAAARLSHPNIVGVHDVFADGERVLIVMELVAGPTLDQVVASSGAQSPEVVRAVMAQVAQALSAAHGAGVIHRDLKPENIFWTNGRAVVADFGLARIGAGRGTIEGTVMGTPGYMAPEQIKGSPTGPATDVFGWGAVAYHLAAGRAPFGEQSQTDPSAMAYRIVHQDPESLSLPGDPALATLITQALSKDPGTRPANGMALAAMLAAGVSFPRPKAFADEPAPTRELPMAREDVPGPSAPSMAEWAWGPTTKAGANTPDPPSTAGWFIGTDEAKLPNRGSIAGWLANEARHWLVVSDLVRPRGLFRRLAGSPPIHGPARHWLVVILAPVGIVLVLGFLAIGSRMSSPGGYIGVITRDTGDTRRGAEVVDLVVGGPAEVNGIQIGDLVTAVNGSEVIDTNVLIRILSGLSPRANVTVLFERNGITSAVPVTLGERPARGTSVRGKTGGSISFP